MRVPVMAIATVLMLGAATPADAQCSAQCSVQSGEVTVDDVTNTCPQICDGLIQVALGGTATLHILDGRLMRSTGSPGQTTIALSAFMTGPSDGTVNVMGNHSRLQVGTTLHVGWGNTDSSGSLGRLNIGAGGRVSAASADVPFAGRLAQGFVTISGPGSMLETVGTLTLRNGTDVDGSVTIETGGTLSVGTSISISGGGIPHIFLEGGTLSLTGPSAVPGGVGGGIIQFSSGAFRFRSSQTLDGSAGFYTDYLGSPPVLPAGRGLVVDGTTTLATALALDGGSLRTDRLAVDPATGSLSLGGGTLTLTGEGAVIDDGADFGPNALTVGDGTGAPARLELRGAGAVLLGDVTILADGALSFSGEALVMDSLDNAGSVTVVGATLDARAGLLNTGSLKLADVVVEGDVTSPAGSSIDVSGTVVFNGIFSGGAAFYGSGTVIFNDGTGAAPLVNGAGTTVIYGPHSRVHKSAVL